MMTQPDFRADAVGRRSRRTLTRAAVTVAAIAALMACAGDPSGPDASDVNYHSKKYQPPPPPPADSAPTPTPVAGNPILGATFWVDPYSNAQKTADSWRVNNPADAA